MKGLPYAIATTAFVLFVSSPVCADIMIDDFEDLSEWRGLDLDTTTVKRGSGAGRWDDHLAQSSISKDFDTPLDASAERLVHFWMYSGAANGAEIELIFDSDNDADPSGWDYYHSGIVVDWTGWRSFRMALDSFTVARVPVGWHEINSVSFRASGWGHEPLGDTQLILDDMSFGTGVISTVHVDPAWSGADFVYTYTLDLEERTGSARTLELALQGGPSYPFTLHLAEGVVSLPAAGTGRAVATITIPSAAISPSTWLDPERAALTLTEDGLVRDSAELLAAIPLPPRGHPRTLLDQEDFERIETWRTVQPWAASVRQDILAAAERWPGDFESEYLVSPWALPPEGGQWNLWYVCPDHGARLSYEGSGRHVCPVDREVFSGWPYDQVVYSRMHNDLARSARDLGLAYRLTGNDAYARSAAEILLAYAERYGSYPIHNRHGGPSRSGGRVLSQTLDESGWLMQIAWAYDLVGDAPVLTAVERSRIEEDLLREAIATIARNRAGRSNWQSWHNAGIGAAGFALEDPVIISQAIRGPEGFEFQMGASVTADGLWYEGAWGYHFFALDALVYLAEMATRAGYDLYGCQALRSMFELPHEFVMPDWTLPPFNDSGMTSILGRDRLYEVAYRRYGDEALTAVLGKRARGRHALFWGVETLPSSAAPDLSSRVFPESGYAVLRAGHGDAAVYLALDFGPHGGWHGHYDKLGFVLFARGAVMAIDPGTQSYALPSHETWDKVTIAHNTVAVDEQNQAQATGNLHRWCAAPALAMVAADAGDAYAGSNTVVLRTMVVSPDYVIDRTRARSTDGTDHDYDWTYHNAGMVSTPLPTAPYAGLPRANGYEHLSDVAATATSADWEATFDVNESEPQYGSVWANDGGILAAFEYSEEQAASGRWSGRMTYDFSAASGYILYSAEPPELVSEVPAALKVRIHGDGSGNRLALRVYDSSDERFVRTIGPVDWSGWQTVEVSNIPSWSHHLGNDDGVFDPPSARVSVQLSSVVGAQLRGSLYIDDVVLRYSEAGDVLVEDFEIPERSLRVRMLGEVGTTVATGLGLGPDLQVPVPFVMARRRGQHSTFAALLEPFGGSPSVESFAGLPTGAPEADEAAAFVVEGNHFSDLLLVVADGAEGSRRTFGGAACDGVLCLIRTEPPAQLARLVLARGSSLHDGRRSVIESSAPLVALEADYGANGTRLELYEEAGVAAEVRILGPDVDEVRLNGEPLAFARDGEYLVVELGECGSHRGAQKPGDANQDGVTDVSDAVVLLDFLFLGRIVELPCGEPGGREPDGTSDPAHPENQTADIALLDWNGDGAIDLSDGVGLLQWKFLGAPPHVLGAPTKCTLISGCPDVCARCPGI